jgi:hypothetical protein
VVRRSTAPDLLMQAIAAILGHPSGKNTSEYRRRSAATAVRKRS